MDYLNDYLNSVNPFYPSQKRKDIFNEISKLDPANPLDMNLVWPHQCGIKTVINWDNKLDDPKGYVRQDDYLFTTYKNKTNWSAPYVENLRFKNAISYCTKLQLLNDGVPIEQLDKEILSSVHPNLFGVQLNLEIEIKKRSDWFGDLRSRYLRIKGQY